MDDHEGWESRESKVLVLWSSLSSRGYDGISTHRDCWNVEK